MKRRIPAAQAPERHAITERADGFYWRGVQGNERGPFVTLGEAEADALLGGEAGVGAGLDAASLQEAESEIGVSEWIDPDSGMPAEDSIPRLEDH